MLIHAIGISRKTRKNKARGSAGRPRTLPLANIIVLSHLQRNHPPLIYPEKAQKKRPSWPVSSAFGQGENFEGYQNLHPHKTIAAAQTKHLAEYAIC